MPLGFEKLVPQPVKKLSSKALKSSSPSLGNSSRSFQAHSWSRKSVRSSTSSFIAHNSRPLINPAFFCRNISHRHLGRSPSHHVHKVARAESLSESSGYRVPDRVEGYAVALRPVFINTQTSGQPWQKERAPPGKAFHPV